MIKTASVFTRNASQIIAEILNVCTGLSPNELDKKLWKAVVRENNYVLSRDEDQGIGTPVTSAVLRIDRIPQGFFDKLLQLSLGNFGLTVYIPPVHSHVKIHSVGVDVMFGDRRIERRKSVLARTLYRKDLEQILSTLKKEVPELNVLLL